MYTIKVKSPSYFYFKNNKNVCFPLQYQYIYVVLFQNPETKEIERGSIQQKLVNGSKLQVQITSYSGVYNANNIKIKKILFRLYNFSKMKRQLSYHHFNVKYLDNDGIQKIAELDNMTDYGHTRLIIKKEEKEIYTYQILGYSFDEEFNQQNQNYSSFYKVIRLNNKKYSFHPFLNFCYYRIICSYKNKEYKALIINDIVILENHKKLCIQNVKIKKIYGLLCLALGEQIIFNYNGDVVKGFLISKENEDLKYIKYFYHKDIVFKVHCYSKKYNGKTLKVHPMDIIDNDFTIF